MSKLFLTELIKVELNPIRANWVEEIEEKADSVLEITDSFFDHLMTTNNFGELLKRSNETTYMAVRAESDSENVTAIAEIIFSRLGAETRCKIMDITYAPHIDRLDDEDFEEKTFRIFLATLGYMLNINNTTRHGITKVYAKNNTVKSAMEVLQAEAHVAALSEIGFTMRSSGRMWLEFEKQS